jgi:hypothetical protein
MIARDVALARGVSAALVLLVLACSTHRYTQPGQSPRPHSLIKVDKAPLEPSPLLEAPVEPAEPVYFSHRVKWPGETFIAMARWYTGSGNNWLRLADANPSINPKMIRIGTLIFIPEALVKTREPMPEKFISRPVVDKNRLPSDSEGITLFGPIETNSKTDESKTGLVYPPLETLE